MKVSSSASRRGSPKPWQGNPVQGPCQRRNTNKHNCLAFCRVRRGGQIHSFVTLDPAKLSWLGSRPKCSVNHSEHNVTEGGAGGARGRRRIISVPAARTVQRQPMESKPKKIEAEEAEPKEDGKATGPKRKLP